MTQHIAHLVELLDDPHDAVRRKGAAALSHLAKELWTALPALLRMLGDDDPTVRTAAREALEALASWGGGPARIDPGVPHRGHGAAPDSRRAHRQAC
jgi:hypothetical protein